MNIFKYNPGAKIYYPNLKDRIIEEIHDLIKLPNNDNVFGMVGEKSEISLLRDRYGLSKANVVYGSPLFDLIAPRESFGMMSFVGAVGFDDIIRRLEFYYRHLMPNGVLVIRASLDSFRNPKLTKFVTSLFKQFSVYSDFASSKCYLVCIKKKGKSLKDEQEYISAVRRPFALADATDDDVEVAGQHVYDIPVYGGLFRFRSRKLTHESAVDIANENIGIVSAFMSKYMQTNGSSRDVKTIHPPRIGHQAILIASGEFDGAYLYNNELVVLNGTVTNNRFKSVMGDSDVETLKPTSTIIALNLAETLRDEALSVSVLE